MKSLAGSSPSSKQNIASHVSLMTAENGMQSDIIHALKTANDQLKDELRIKDRLVQKLLEEGEEDKIEQPTKKNDDLQSRSLQRSDNQKSQTNFILKLKSEIDMAYKILAQRDQEIVQLKKQSKQMMFQKCNEERIQYMNECMKL